MIDASQFGVMMDKLRDEAKRGLIAPEYGTLPNQGRLLVQRLLKLTPASSEDQQRAAIRSDMFEIFEIRRAETIQACVLLYGRGQINGWVNDEKLGVHLQIQAAGVVLNEGEARAVHKRHYTQRGRTVRLARGQKYLISPQLFDAYLNFLYVTIGKGKAGWLAAAQGLGARVPRWVSRHGSAQGSYTNGLNAEKPFIAARNFSKWADRDEAERIMNSALASRIRDMKTYAERQLELAAKKALAA